MEEKSDKISSQKCERGDRNMDKLALLLPNDFIESNLPCDAVLRLEDGSAFHVHRETLSKGSEYFRYVWLLI
jgi:kelch-like protein 10